MRRHLTAAAVLVLGGLVLTSGCGSAGGEGRTATPPGTPAGPPSGFPDWALGSFSPPLEAMVSAGGSAEAREALGRALFYEPLLSGDRDASCNSCHPLAEWGTTTSPVLNGKSRRASRLDIPSVYNAAAEVDLFWDGRAHNVDEQAKASIKSPLEMALPDEAAVVARLKESGKYQAAFRAAFPSDQEPLTLDNVARAIGAFERGLVTPSRWDQFLRGNRDALTSEEKKGFETFVNKGCSDCHNGAAVGGRMYQVAGAVKPWPLQSDSGRYSTTRKLEDLFVFRVPPLRNIEKTGPYFDTGVVTELPEAIRLMARYQRGMNLTEDDVAEIATWLKTLTGDIPTQYIARRAPAAH